MTIKWTVSMVAAMSGFIGGTSLVITSSNDAVKESGAILAMICAAAIILIRETRDTIGGREMSTNRLRVLKALSAFGVLYGAMKVVVGVFHVTAVTGLVGAFEGFGFILLSLIVLDLVAEVMDKTP